MLPKPLKQLDQRQTGITGGVVNDSLLSKPPAPERFPLQARFKQLPDHLYFG